MTSFKHDLFEFPKLEQLNTDDGRFYLTPEGNRYPSVTTVLSKHNDKNIYLDQWKERVGEDVATKITKTSARKGISVHKIVEKFLLNESDYLKGQMPINIFQFNAIKQHYIDNITEVNGVEARLYSDELRTAGTADCLCKWKGIPAIVDTKTSRSIKKEEWITDYFIQTTAYSLMVKEQFGLEVPLIVIIMTVDHDKPLLFVKKSADYVEQTKEIFGNYDSYYS